MIVWTGLHQFSFVSLSCLFNFFSLFFKARQTSESKMADGEEAKVCLPPGTFLFRGLFDIKYILKITFFVSV